MARSDPHNSTQYWWDRHLASLSLLQADFTTHEYPLLTHEALVIAMTELGGSIVRSRGQIEQATPSTLFVSNPGEPHAGRMGWSERWRYRSMYLTREALAEVAGGLGLHEVPYFTSNILADRDLIDAFLAMHMAIEEGRDVFRERELLIATFGTLFQRHGGGRGIRIDMAPRDRTLLDRVKDRMQAEYVRELRLEELAVEVGLTTFQPIGLFKRTVGMTPHAYLTQVRLNVACRHLARATPLAEVASDAGFYDQSALTKHFKRCYGITPLQFARAAAA